MKKIIQSYIITWKTRCYSDLPDEAPVRLDQLNKVPSYKRCCLAILNNDITKVGGNLPHSHYYDSLKKIELGIKEYQLKLW